MPLKGDSKSDEYRELYDVFWMERDKIALEAGVELTTASAKNKLIKTKPQSSANGPAETHRLVPLKDEEIN